MRQTIVTAEQIHGEINKFTKRVHDLAYELHDVEVKLGKNSGAYETMEDVYQDALTDLETARNQKFIVMVNRHFKE